MECETRLNKTHHYYHQLRHYYQIRIEMHDHAEELHCFCSFNFLLSPFVVLQFLKKYFCSILECFNLFIHCKNYFIKDNFGFQHFNFSARVSLINVHFFFLSLCFSSMKVEVKLSIDFMIIIKLNWIRIKNNYKQS